jgi:hypothetical protein
MTGSCVVDHVEGLGVRAGDRPRGVAHLDRVSQRIRGRATLGVATVVRVVDVDAVGRGGGQDLRPGPPRPQRPARTGQRRPSQPARIDVRIGSRPGCSHRLRRAGASIAHRHVRTLRWRDERSLVLVALTHPEDHRATSTVRSISMSTSPCLDWGVLSRPARALPKQDRGRGVGCRLACLYTYEARLSCCRIRRNVQHGDNALSRLAVRAFGLDSPARHDVEGSEQRDVKESTGRAR